MSTKLTTVNDVSKKGSLCDDELLLNPFVHHLELETTYEKVKTAVLTIILLPIRVSLICVLLISGWLLACIGLWGLTEDDLRREPLTGWRRKLPSILCFLGQSTYKAGGMNVIIKGRQATRKEAPILVIAPHSTFLDGGIVYATGFPSIIVRRESGTNPYIGKLINFTQPIYVWRDDAESRQKTIKEIINRAKSNLDWPQILIFPEGTCTNRSCLITFKPGAFYPGVPIQPVCIRYPNKLDTVTWTWEGPSALKLLWLTLSQPYSSCEIEFLPVYTPNEQEKNDPKLFANNVRAVMSKALGIPVSDYTYGDCKLMAKAKEMNLPYATSLVEVQKLRHKLGLSNSTIEETILDQINCKDCNKVTFLDFCKILKITTNDLAQHLFKLYDKHSTGTIDFRDYLLGILILSSTKYQTIYEACKLACKLYDTSNCGRLTANEFSKALQHTLAISKEYALDIFFEIDKNHLNTITFDDFVKYAQNKAEFNHLFNNNEKSVPNNEQICPNLSDVNVKKND